MYNQERKLDFINQYTQSKKTAYYTRVIFNKFEPYEEEQGLDLCILPVQIVEHVINSLTGTRMESAERALIVVREYIKWCQRTNIESNNDIISIRTNVIDRVKRKMIRDPEDLQQRLDKLLEKEVEETVDCLYRAFVWMAYMGISDKDAVEITIDEVDLQRRIIQHNGIQYDIYKEAVEAFEKACTLNSFNYIHYSPYYKTLVPRVAGNRLLRGSRGDFKLPSVKAKFRGLIKKVSTGYEKDIAETLNLTFINIHYSGLFYRTYIHEKTSGEIFFGKYVADEIQRKEYTLSPKRTENTIANQRERALKADYEKWKCAFDI